MAHSLRSPQGRAAASEMPDGYFYPMESCNISGLYLGWVKAVLHIVDSCFVSAIAYWGNCGLNCFSRRAQVPAQRFAAYGSADTCRSKATSSQIGMDPIIAVSDGRAREEDSCTHNSCASIGLFCSHVSWNYQVANDLPVPHLSFAGECTDARHSCSPMA